MGEIVAVTGVTGDVGGKTAELLRAVPEMRPGWLYIIGNLVAVLLALVNAFVHSRDGYTAVVPTGLILSAVVVVILAITSRTTWGLVYRDRNGIIS